MELLQQILPLERGISVILMTGYYSSESAGQAIQLAAADYFPKPFSPSKLRERMISSLRTKNAASAAPRWTALQKSKEKPFGKCKPLFSLQRTCQRLENAD